MNFLIRIGGLILLILLAVAILYVFIVLGMLLYRSALLMFMVVWRSASDAHREFGVFWSSEVKDKKKSSVRIAGVELYTDKPITSDFREWAAENQIVITYERR